MNTTNVENPVELLIKSFGWQAAGSNIINGNEVEFFTHPDHPEKLLKWYPSRKGFMISYRGAHIRARGLEYEGMEGRSQPITPFTTDSRLLEAIENLTEESAKW